MVAPNNMAVFMVPTPFPTQLLVFVQEMWLGNQPALWRGRALFAAVFQTWTSPRPIVGRTIKPELAKIGVEDLRTAIICEGVPDRIDAEPSLHRVRQTPRQDAS